MSGVTGRGPPITSGVTGRGPPIDLQGLEQFQAQKKPPKGLLPVGYKELQEAAELNPLDDQRNALTHANAHGAQRVSARGVLQTVEGGGDQSRA